MGLNIEDGMGRGNVAGVSKDNRLMVAAKVNNRGYYVSRDEQRLFNAVFSDASATATNYVAYIKNTSTTRRLVIEFIRVEGVGGATPPIWRVVTATGTATGGTAVTAVNMNRGSAISAEATLLADNIGGFTAGTPLIASVRHPSNDSKQIDFDDTLILGQNDAIAIQYFAGTTAEASVTIRFYYEDII